MIHYILGYQVLCYRGLSSFQIKQKFVKSGHTCDAVHSVLVKIVKKAMALDLRVLDVVVPNFGLDTLSGQQKHPPSAVIWKESVSCSSRLEMANRYEMHTSGTT